jgi:hypothetical protein
VAQFLWYQKVAKQLAKPGGNLTSGKVKALASAVLAQCDILDGLVDGDIGRPDACTFDVASLKCTGAETDACFTDAQLESVKAIYEPTNVAGYVWPGFPFGGETFGADSLQAWGGPGATNLGQGFIQYMLTQNPSADWLAVGCSAPGAGTSRPCSRRSRSSARSASPRFTGSSPSARADQSNRQLRTAREMVLHALTSLTETRDFETGAHLIRTSRYARALGEALASFPRFRSFLTPETIDLIARLAPIHDIGKVGVADRTLRKPGPLSEDEREEMSRHPTYGRDVIARTEERVGVRDDFLLKLAKEIVYSHHEHWDGSGYPEGLRGEAIPVAGRMVALVDVYDALASARVYKGALPHEEVVQAIVAGRGVHFDPDMVDAFLGIQEEWRRIAIDFADDEHGHPPDEGQRLDAV